MSAPRASVLQQLVFERAALGAEVDEEGAGGRARTQLLQLVVMGPLDIAPLLDLRRGREVPWSEWLVPSARQPGPHTIRVAGVRATGFDLAKTCPTRVVGEVGGKNTQVARVGTRSTGHAWSGRGAGQAPAQWVPTAGQARHQNHMCVSPEAQSVPFPHFFPHGGCKC